MKSKKVVLAATLAGLLFNVYPADAGRKEKRKIEALEREVVALREQIARSDKELKKTERQLDAANARIESLMTEIKDSRVQAESSLSAERSSREEYQAFHKVAQDQYNECYNRLTALQNTDKGFLISNLKDCKADAAAAIAACEKDKGRVKQIAYLAGKEEVLNSIEIIGRPTVKEGWFFDDYYHIQVSYGDRVKLLMTVRTEKKETAFTNVLGGIGEIALPLLGKL